ncbi:long-chain fatty acid transport protein [Thiohalobacter thiocyanaticus]|uniref:Long-chain fatty acid transport protein n=1 Tax=Thiohalobacter thiocyanaticus TaxID=585455 RepID=A0A1Z4VNL2_9GAMM|nr:outer membrane protein transport protein [Thiohalobacter thiocyanaticus]BAZ93191.1 long-chain fatty acid transport protein [Thiohalobacter thiocyanaticus]
MTRLLPLCAALSAVIPSAAVATNGYFLIGFGAKSRAMGGVGVAYAQDALAAAANPAAMMDIDMNTLRVDVGGEFFNPPRSIYHSSDTLGTTNGVTSEKSGSNIFLIPNMGGAFRFNRDMVIGMAAIGAGLGTRYNQEVPGNPSCVNGDTSGGTDSYFFNFNCNADSTTVGVMLMQMQMLPSVAYRVHRDHTLGASVALAVQTFRAYGLGAFEDLGFAAATDRVSGEGNDWSYGAGFRLGGLHKFFDDKLTFGWNYASRVYMTEFKKYENLFAEQGDFDIPAHYTVGIAYQPTKKLTIAADVQYIDYSSIRSVSNPGPIDPVDLNPLCPGDDSLDPSRCNLGGNDGMGFGWEDQTVYKLGVNYDYNKTWSFRAGVNYGESPIQEDQVLFNMLAPATVEWHLTFGASYRPSPNIEWSFNYMHAFENTIKGTTAFTNRAPGEDNAAISMYQNSLGVSFAFKM